MREGSIGAPTRHALARHDADFFDAGKLDAERAERRRAMRAIKRDRRLGIGPHATIYFESYDTMWWQIHEMPFVEQGGEAQIADELAAYNPLIPNGVELTATLMFEIDDPARRDALLTKLGGVEDSVTIGVGGAVVTGVPEGDVARSTPDGRASSVDFPHLRFTPAQITKCRDPATPDVVGIGHARYGHMAVMPEPMRAALAADFH